MTLKSFLIWMLCALFSLVCLLISAGLLFTAAVLWVDCSPCAVFLGLFGFIVGAVAIGFFLDVCLSL